MLFNDAIALDLLDNFMKTVQIVYNIYTYNFPMFPHDVNGTTVMLKPQSHVKQVEVVLLWWQRKCHVDWIWVHQWTRDIWRPVSWRVLYAAY